MNLIEYGLHFLHFGWLLKLNEDEGNTQEHDWQIVLYKA